MSFAILFNPGPEWLAAGDPSAYADWSYPIVVKHGLASGDEAREWIVANHGPNPADWYGVEPCVPEFPDECQS